MQAKIPVSESDYEKLDEVAKFFEKPLPEILSEVIAAMHSFTFDGEVDEDAFQKRKNSFRYCHRIG